MEFPKKQNSKDRKVLLGVGDMREAVGHSSHVAMFVGGIVFVVKIFFEASYLSGLGLHGSDKLIGQRDPGIYLSLPLPCNGIICVYTKSHF